MPTYEYACKSCGEHLEVAQSFKDDALTQCPACGGPLRKVFGNIGITFKGSGFYRTDSRSDGRKGAQKSGEGKAGEGKASEVKSGEASSGGSTKSDTSSSSSGHRARPSHRARRVHQARRAAQNRRARPRAAPAASRPRPDRVGPFLGGQQRTPAKTAKPRPSTSRKWPASRRPPATAATRRRWLPR